MRFFADKKEYVLAEGQIELPVTLAWRNDKGIEVKKTLTFKRDDYAINVNYQIENHSPSDWQGNLYSLLKRNQATQRKGPFQFATYLGAALSSPAKPFEKISFSKMQQENVDRMVAGGWIAMLQHYFLSAWVPDNQQTYRYYTKVTADNHYVIGMLSPLLQVAPGQSKNVSAKLYLGPSISERLQAVAPHLNLAVDYGWLWFIADIIFWLMKHIYNIVGNWGWSIVLVTVFIKALFYKLSATSYQSMAALRKLQPRLQTIKERYGDESAKA